MGARDGGSERQPEAAAGLAAGSVAARETGDEPDFFSMSSTF